MRIATLILVFLMSGCTINIATDNFIYQDEAIEQLDLDIIKTEVNQDATLTNISEVSLTTQDGLTLKGVKLLHENAKVNIVFFGGNGMKINQSYKILNHFSLLPANVIWFDYRGSGLSAKKDGLTVSELKNDSLNIFDFARNELPSTIPLVVNGVSMGTLLASYTASERSVDGLVLDGAIGSVPELVDSLIPGWSRLFSTINITPELAEINNNDIIKKYDAPLLLLVGAEDEVTPVAFAETLYDSSGSPIKKLAVIPDAPHGFTMKYDEAINAYQAFIEQLSCCKQTN